MRKHASRSYYMCYLLHLYQVHLSVRDLGNVESLKTDMKSYKPLETAAIYFLSNLCLKQGIGSAYVIVDYICKG